MTTHATARLLSTLAGLTLVAAAVAYHVHAAAPLPPDTYLGI